MSRVLRTGESQITDDDRADSAFKAMMAADAAARHPQVNWLTGAPWGRATAMNTGGMAASNAPTCAFGCDRRTAFRPT